MSNSFSESQFAGSAIPQWLGVISRELRLMVHEITALGEQLSAAVHSDPALGDVSALQSFDLLAQKASALAALLAGLERRGPGSLNDLIAQVPFYEIRERLFRVAGRRDDGETHTIERSNNDTEWF